MLFCALCQRQGAVRANYSEGKHTLSLENQPQVSLTKGVITPQSCETCEELTKKGIQGRGGTSVSNIYGMCRTNWSLFLYWESLTNGSLFLTHID